MDRTRTTILTREVDPIRPVPSCYDSQGNYRSKPRDIPWALCVVIFVGGFLIARVM